MPAGPVPVVEEVLELQMKLELDVLVIVRFFLYVVDYPGHGDAFLDSGEPLRMIDVLLPSHIASPWRRKLWRPQPAQAGTPVVVFRLVAARCSEVDVPY